MRRRLLAALGAGFVLLAAFVAFAGWRALQVRDALLAGKADAAAVQQAFSAGDVERGRELLPRLRRELDRAASRSDGPAWAVAQRVPVLGRSFSAVRGVALAGRQLGDTALPEAVAALDLVESGHPLRDGRVDLPLLHRLAGHLDRAVGALQRAKAAVDGPDHWLLPGVGHGVGDAQRRIGSLDAELGNAKTALDLAPAMLGAAGPRDYFVAVQNNAEARATGGLIGAFAILRADRGRLSLLRTGTDRELRVADKEVPAAAGAATYWQRLGSTSAWYSANLTPHFPDAAQNLALLWQAQGGGRVDGVIGLDLVVFKDLLAATAPVRLPDGSLITSANVVDFVAHQEYVKYPDTPARKALLRDLAKDVFAAVTHPADSVRVLRGLARSGSSGHLMVWSGHPDEQARLARVKAAGALPPGSGAFLELVTQNFGGNKLDYYLRRRIEVDPLPQHRVRVHVTLTNAAPLGLPEYMTIRSDRPQPPRPYGQAKTSVTLYLSRSSLVSRFLVDGRAVTPKAYGTDHGLAFVTIDLELPRNRPVELTVEMTQPAGRLLVRQQPVLTPDDLVVRVPEYALD